MFRNTVTTMTVYTPIGEDYPTILWKELTRGSVAETRGRKYSYGSSVHNNRGRDGCPGTLPQTHGGVRIVAGPRSQSDDRYGAGLGDEDRRIHDDHEDRLIKRRMFFAEENCENPRSPNGVHETEGATGCRRKFPRRVPPPF